MEFFIHQCNTCNFSLIVGTLSSKNYLYSSGRVVGPHLMKEWPHKLRLHYKCAQKVVNILLMLKKDTFAIVVFPSNK